ncbi:hypothetical protein TWF970_007067 [Orbilia oligospora]|uniref:Uncharacterized protein n=1 Tax=Orbilia oligospora TaxID=2813651 RepID=A0A7C8RN28_ORBOL|nr:hypothetical protein TWF970_007067 [Orbilia oligospora]
MSGSCPEDNFRPPGYEFEELDHDHPNTDNYDQWRTSTVQVPYGGYPLSSQFLISAGLYGPGSGSGFPNIQLPLEPPQPINYMFRFPPQPLPQNPFPPGYSDAEARFPHPSDGKMGEPMKYREACLRRFSAAIRNKPNWTEKILDRKLFIKWLRETKAADSYPRGQKTLLWTKDDIHFVYKELTKRYKAYVEGCEFKGRLQPDIDGVWRCDDFLDEKERRELIDAISTLENIPEGQKDWHPNSNNQVLNLVHPSLWPIIYNVTIDTSGNSVAPPNGKKDWVSKSFCWLPSEFEISPHGETKVASYINNLSTPKQKELFYPILGRIFDKFIPLFNHVLANLKEGSYDHKRVERDYRYAPPEILSQRDHDRRWERLLKQFEERKYLLTVGLHKNEPENYYCGLSDDADGQEEAVDNEINLDYEEESDCEDQYECGRDYYIVRDMGYILDQRMWRPPKPQTLKDVKLEGTTARVIVKIASIILTPDKPEYTGGTWHVEAMENERIVSTGIYYYSQENTTTSHLAFRKEVTLGKPDENEWSGDEFDDDEGNETWRWNNRDPEREDDWEAKYDMNILDQPNQKLGAVETKENRAIAFPNIFQHRVEPFELIDKSKEGHRKILVFFLCDPSHNIPTSRTIAPQQPEFREEFVQALNDGPIGNLPPELHQEILGRLPPVISKAEALEHRKHLMEERGKATKKTGERFGRSTSYHL